MPYDEPVTAAPQPEHVEAAPERAPAVPAIAPASFHAVSEHDQVESEPAHRPNRRRHQSAASAAQAQDLQLVETQGAPVEAPAVDEDQPRRTKPRRRRGGAASAEPLQMVETQGDSPAAQSGDGTPAQ
jgi:hypothetical protein